MHQDQVAAVPKLMAELGFTGVLFTVAALRCQKDGFAQAAATGNALLVRVKDNQPTLRATLAGLCAAGCPFGRHETVDPAANPLGFGVAAMKPFGFRRGRHGRQKHRRVEVFDTAGLLGPPWQAPVSRVARVSRRPTSRTPAPACGPRARKWASTPARPAMMPKCLEAPSSRTGASRTAPVTSGT